MHTGFRKSQRGIALMEALVGLLIFSFGVLGLIGLQANMSKAQSSAKFRAEAASLAEDLFGRMQSEHLSRWSLYGGSACASAYARCTDWRRRVSSLPNGEATVTVNAVTGAVQVSISWQHGGEARNRFESAMQWQP